MQYAVCGYWVKTREQYRGNVEEFELVRQETILCLVSAFDNHMNILLEKYIPPVNVVHSGVDAAGTFAEVSALLSEELRCVLYFTQIKVINHHNNKQASQSNTNFHETSIREHLQSCEIHILIVQNRT